MYVSRICLITKYLRIDIHWLFPLENLTGSSIEKYNKPNNLEPKNWDPMKWLCSYENPTGSSNDTMIKQQTK